MARRSLLCASLAGALIATSAPGPSSLASTGESPPEDDGARERSESPPQRLAAEGPAAAADDDRDAAPATQDQPPTREPPPKPGPGPGPGPAPASPATAPPVPEGATPERVGEADDRPGTVPPVTVQTEGIAGLPADRGPDDGPRTQHLSLDEAIELALANHPSVSNARHQAEAAKTRIGQAQADYYPQIDGWLQYNRATENGSLNSFYSVPGSTRVGGSTRDGVSALDSFNNYMAALVLRQLVWDFGRTAGKVDAQEAFAQMAKVNEEFVKQSVTFGVMRAYFAVWAAQANIELARENEKTALAILELADAAHRAGLKPESEPARARATVASARVAIIQAEAQLEIARARVANAIGVPNGHYEPTGFALSATPLATEDELLEIAMTHRPELQIVGHEREGLTGTLRAVKGKQYPRIEALAGANSRGQFLTDHGQDPYQRFNASVGVNMQVPIFQGLRVRKQKQEVSAQMKALDDRQEMVRQAIVLEVRQAMAAVKAADAAAEASAEGVEAALKAVEVLEGRYPEGLTKLVELTDAQKAYIEALSQQVRATYDRFLSRAALSIAIGRPSP